jgi:hypothetical protein
VIAGLGATMDSASVAGPGPLQRGSDFRPAEARALGRRSAAAAAGGAACWRIGDPDASGTGEQKSSPVPRA